jgi:hypothetical protein
MAMHAVAMNGNRAEGGMTMQLNRGSLGFRLLTPVARHVASSYALGEASWPVAVGDDTDLRFLDPKQTVIALYAKGNAKRDASGFVRD